MRAGRVSKRRFGPTDTTMDREQEGRNSENENGIRRKYRKKGKREKEREEPAEPVRTEE